MCLYLSFESDISFYLCLHEVGGFVILRFIHHLLFFTLKITWSFLWSRLISDVIQKLVATGYILDILLMDLLLNYLVVDYVDVLSFLHSIVRNCKEFKVIFVQVFQNINNRILMINNLIEVFRWFLYHSNLLLVNYYWSSINCGFLWAHSLFSLHFFNLHDFKELLEIIFNFWIVKCCQVIIFLSRFVLLWIRFLLI